MLFLYFSSIFWREASYFRGPFQEKLESIWKIQTQKTVPLLSNEKKKKVSYTADAFALNKTLGFLVSAEEKDKVALKNYQNKVYFRCRCF